MVMPGWAGCLWSGWSFLCKEHLRGCCDKTTRVCYILGQPVLRTLVFCNESSGVLELCCCVVLSRSLLSGKVSMCLSFVPMYSPISHPSERNIPPPTPTGEEGHWHHLRGVEGSCRPGTYLCIYIIYACIYTYIYIYISYYIFAKPYLGLGPPSSCKDSTNYLITFLH